MPPRQAYKESALEVLSNIIERHMAVADTLEPAFVALRDLLSHCPPAGAGAEGAALLKLVSSAQQVPQAYHP